MSEDTKKRDESGIPIPRILADFGGRRKVFDRRFRLKANGDFDRRSGLDRRSGFDRRSTYHRPPLDLPHKRHDDKG